MDIFSGYVYNLCMMPLMVKEADLNRIEVPEDYEVLDATALGRQLGFKRDTVLAYLSRRNFRRIPRPNRQLAMGPLVRVSLRHLRSIVTLMIHGTRKHAAGPRARLPGASQGESFRSSGSRPVSFTMRSTQGR